MSSTSKWRGFRLFFQGTRYLTKQATALLIWPSWQRLASCCSSERACVYLSLFLLVALSLSGPADALRSLTSHFSLVHSHKRSFLLYSLSQLLFNNSRTVRFLSWHFLFLLLLLVLLLARKSRWGCRWAQSQPKKDTLVPGDTQRLPFPLGSDTKARLPIALNISKIGTYICPSTMYPKMIL